MDAQTKNESQAAHNAVAVNRNLAIEITLDEILEDLLFPATRGGAPK